jgi:hypothetical protein
MFFSSYTLLFLGMAIKYEASKMWLLLLGVSIIGFISTLFIIKRKINLDETNIVEITSKNDQVLGYLATYLIPMLDFNLENLRDIFSLAIIFFVIAILYIKADLIYINPMLMLFGYNIYEVKISNNSSRILISKKSLQELKGKKIAFYEIQDRFIIKEKDR